MEFVLLVVMLTSCAAAPQDLSGKMFTFPQETKQAHVKLITSRQDFGAVTLCQRSFTDLKRDHALFSLSTSSNPNDFLIFWDATNGEMEPHVGNSKVEFGDKDYKRNMWHSICTTWDSTSGLVQLWLDGQPSIMKFMNSRNISGPTAIILGQEQDSHGGGFDLKQSFVGMMSDVHMWNYILSSCEIRNYMDYRSFTPGNVLNWKALEFQIRDRVLLENKEMTCP